MKKFLLIIFVLFLSLLIIKINAEDNNNGNDQQNEETTNDGILAIYVQTADNDKIQGMSINLRSTNYNQNKTTDVQGKAVFDELEYGTYTVTINLPDNSEYILVAGEVAEKTVDIDSSDVKTIYFGVKPNPNYKDPNEPEKLEIKLPNIFKGSTTSLNEKTKDELKNIENFTLEIPDKIKVIFKEKIDLSSDDTISRLNELDKYVVMNQLGLITIKSDLMPELDKPAKITFFDINYVPLGKDYLPTILTDSKLNTTTVKNITLRGNKIEFEVTGFSTYSLKPQMTIEEVPNTTEQDTIQIKGEIDDLDASIIVYLNGQLLNQDITISNEGKFNINLNLDKQENKIKILATGISGEQITKNFDVTYANAQNQEQLPTQGDNVSKTVSIILSVFLITTGVSTGIWYYYRTKNNLPLWPFEKKDENLENKETEKINYDTRLLTPEEKELFLKKDKNEKNDTISL